MFPMSRKKSFLENLKEILIYTFPADGHDPITHRLNNETYSLEHLSKEYIKEGVQVITADKERAEAFIRDPLTIYTSVLGLPNRAEENTLETLNGNDTVTTFTQSGWNLLRRFTGYSRSAELSAKIFIVPFFTLLNLAATPFRFLTRVVTLFTEVLPAILLMLVQTKVFSPLWKKTNDQYDEENYASMLGYGFLTAAALPLLGASYIVWFYGRCATSPVQAVRESWHTGSKSYGFIGGVVLSLLTITNIMALYAVLAPLTVKFLSLQVLPWVATHAPAGAAGLLKPIFTTLGPIFNALGKAGLALASHFSVLCNIPGVTAIMAVMPEMVGIGFITGILTSTAGPILGYLENIFVENFWYRKPFGTAQESITDVDVDYESESDLRRDDTITNDESPAKLRSIPGDNFHYSPGGTMFGAAHSPIRSDADSFLKESVSHNSNSDSSNDYEWSTNDDSDIESALK